MEYLDILDSNGKPTGEKKTAPEVHKDGDWHRTVHVWIINNRQELLIQKRAPTSRSSPNLWDISAAGHIETGDKSRETAIRETREELGIKLKEDDLKFLFIVKQHKALNNGTYINNEFSNVYLVNLNLKKEEFEIEKKEVSEIKFIYFRELEKITNNKDQNFVSHPEEYIKLFKLLNKRYKK